MVFILMRIFVIASEKPPAPISKELGLFQNTFWSHFCYFITDVAKLNKCNRSNRNAWFGSWWASVVAAFLLIVCICFCVVF